MGHERIGTLPKSQRWRAIVAEIANSDGSNAATIARRTLENVRDRLDAILSDPSLEQTFIFLLALAIASRESDPASRLSQLGVVQPSSMSPLALARALRATVDLRAVSPEYRELCQAAGIDAIAFWTGRNKPEQLPLLGLQDRATDVWRELGTGAGFCELSRAFFASLTERYLSYFLDREASSALSTIAARDAFGRGLEQHIHSVSLHAFETAKITQSFAAGWFNKHARENMPSETEIRGFLAVARTKVTNELLREEMR